MKSPYRGRFRNAKLKVFGDEKEVKKTSSTAKTTTKIKIKKVEVDEKGYITVWDYPCPFIGSFCNGLRICHIKDDEVFKEDCESCTIPDRRYLKVEFIEDCIEFVGVDGVNYGPFLKDDVVELPIENIPPLLKGGFVKIVDSGGDSS